MFIAVVVNVLVFFVLFVRGGRVVVCKHCLCMRWCLMCTLFVSLCLSCCCCVIVGACVLFLSGCVFVCLSVALFCLVCGCFCGVACLLVVCLLCLCAFYGGGLCVVLYIHVCCVYVVLCCHLRLYYHSDYVYISCFCGGVFVVWLCFVRLGVCVGFVVVFV